MPGPGAHETNWNHMANKFGTDIIFQAPDPKVAASFYVQQLGFAITGEQPDMISLHGDHINLFIERGPALGPVLEVTVADVEEAKLRLTRRTMSAARSIAPASRHVEHP